MGPLRAGAEVPEVRSAVVLRVAEDVCAVWCDGAELRARYAPQIPRPRVGRVSPGHLVALAVAPDGGTVLLWRWYDAVVIGHDASGAVRLWEPAHGEVVALPRPSYVRQDPGGRVYASAGLPGAEWWVASAVAGGPVVVEVDAVAALYTANDMWGAALAPQPETG